MKRLLFRRSDPEGVIGWLCLVAGLGCAAAVPQEAAKPLPEKDAFVQNVLKNLRSDRLLLSQYTFTEKTTIRTLGKNRAVKKTEERIYEVYPALDAEKSYRKLVSKNGQPLSPRELEKQDEEQRKEIEKNRRKLERMGQDEVARRAAREAEERRKEEKALQELLLIYDIAMLGREVKDGHDAILLSFRPRPAYRPKTREGRILAKVAGRAWFGENDYQLIRAETELVDTISLGLGILARLDRGASAVFERSKVNDEIWLPAVVRFSGTGRLLLFKGLNLDVTSQYSDYRKFTVKTSVEFTSGEKR